MIRRTETIEIELTPREVAEIIMDMADDEQVDVLRELADCHTFHFANFVMQLECIGEVIEGLLPVDQKRIKRMFDSFVEYIEAIDWEGDMAIEALKQPSDETQLLDDGTLKIKVANVLDIKRIMVMDDNVIYDSYYPERLKGEWKYGNGNGECPFCGREKQHGWDNYCGYCGARMRE